MLGNKKRLIEYDKRKYYKEMVKPKKISTNKDLSPRVGFCYFELGDTSWRKVCSVVDSTLKNNFKKYYPIVFKGKFRSRKLDLLIGQTQFCLEQFIKAAQDNPAVVRVALLATHTESEIAASNNERKACGVRPIDLKSVGLHRYKAERLLADYLLVASQRCKKDLIAAGCPPEKIRILRYGIQVDKPRFRERINKVRFLFIGTDPFRKGIRILFEAWDQLKLKNAELICAVSPEVASSQLLLKYLIKNPSIIIRYLLPLSDYSYKKGFDLYQDIDCQVLPSFHDGFSFAVGEGMGVGKPAIISDRTGIQDLVTHLHDGYIFKSGSVEELKKGIIYFYENREKIKEIGEAAYETASKYSWKRFENELVDLINFLHRQGRIYG